MSAIDTDTPSARNEEVRDIILRPNAKATVKDVSDKIDDARAIALLNQAELRSFKEAIIGIPGVTLGALGEIRNDAKANNDLIQKTLAAQLQFQQDLPGIIDRSINGKLRQRALARVSRLGQIGTTVLGMVVSGILVAVAVLVFHLGASAAK